jgi:hypothetical protein
VVGRQLLPCLSDLIKVELKGQQYRTKALSGNVDFVKIDTLAYKCTYIIIVLHTVFKFG